MHLVCYNEPLVPSLRELEGIRTLRYVWRCFQKFSQFVFLSEQCIKPHCKFRQSKTKSLASLNFLTPYPSCFNL